MKPFIQIEVIDPLEGRAAITMLIPFAVIFHIMPKGSSADASAIITLADGTILHPIATFQQIAAQLMGETVRIYTPKPKTP